MKAASPIPEIVEFRKLLLCTHNICISVPRGIFLHVTISVSANSFIINHKSLYVLAGQFKYGGSRVSSI